MKPDHTTSRPSRLAGRSISFPGAISAAAVAAGLLLSAMPAAAQPAARAARTCSAPRYPGLGYFTSLTVTNTDCATGDKLIVAYYKCRTRSGKSGTCHSRVLGYACHEKRNSIPTEFDARVTCTSGNRTIVHTFQQDT
jgi:hypothetical protein